jgi:hypothetical protein
MITILSIVMITNALYSIFILPTLPSKVKHERETLVFVGNLLIFIWAVVLWVLA